MDLDECFRKGLIKRTEPNKELVKSLVEMANIKEKVVKSAEINKENVSAYVSLAYDSLREVLEAICILHEYKVLSHVCIGELLKKILNDFDYEKFDRLRWIRNSVNYYGQKVELKQGIKIINEIFEMKKKILKDYLEI